MVKNKVIVVVGDVHDHWNRDLDERALQLLNPDLVLFTGDFGDEKVELVREVSKLKTRKAVILGNHDCWYSNKNSSKSQQKATASVKDKRWSRVEQQLKDLGDSHVGYTRKDYFDMKASLVGMRTFAAGGNRIYSEELVDYLYGVKTMDESAQKIMQLVDTAPEGHSLIFLGHNGPTGLGSSRTDICGKDYESAGGDYGDPDCESVLKKCQEKRLRVPLVVFGHMHRDLKLIPGKRTMCVSRAGPNKSVTVYVNAAVVPRCVGNERNFTVVELSPDGSRVVSVVETWVAVEPNAEPRVARSIDLFRAKLFC